MNIINKPKNKTETKRIINRGIAIGLSAFLTIVPLTSIFAETDKFSETDKNEYWWLNTKQKSLLTRYLSGQDVLFKSADFASKGYAAEESKDIVLYIEKSEWGYAYGTDLDKKNITLDIADQDYETIIFLFISPINKKEAEKIGKKMEGYGPVLYKFNRKVGDDGRAELGDEITQIKIIVTKKPMI